MMKGIYRKPRGHQTKLPKWLAEHARKIGKEAKEKGLQEAKRNKYNAEKTIINDEVIDSKLEAGHYADLRLLERAGKITNLRRQVCFEFRVKDILMFRYFADFSFIDRGIKRYIDSKGLDTPISKLKRKIIEAEYGIKIELWKAKGVEV
jgi:hypothetical protein